MKITTAFRIEAAHRLPGVAPSHRCHNLHGHTYRIEVCLEGPVDATTGFVVDFFDIEAVMAPLIERIDHAYLNDVAGLENPTAENIAAWIWAYVRPQLPLLASVRVYENPDCWAQYDGR